jgi:hypothetical protein
VASSFFRGVIPLVIYRIVQEQQPEVIEELKRRRLLSWQPGGDLEEKVIVEGHTYRDVTTQVAAASDDHDPRMDHATWKREGGALRQVRHT